MRLAEEETPDFKSHVLPLARIKKVMKSDEDVQMISAEGKPHVLFSFLARSRSTLAVVPRRCKCRVASRPYP